MTEPIEQPIEGYCPNCEALVPYDQWRAVSGELDTMGCPNCGEVCAIDAVFPEVSP